MGVENLPADDPAKHAIGLNGKGFGLLQYSKRAQEQPIERVRVGTEDLTGSDRLSFWTQSDYSGGAYQETWGDPAMFAASKGIVPDQLGKGVRSIPPLAGNLWAQGLAPAVLGRIPPGTVPSHVLTWSNCVFWCFPTVILKQAYTSTGHSLGLDNLQESIAKRAYAMEASSGRIYAGADDGRVFVYRASDLVLERIIAPVADNSKLTAPAAGGTATTSVPIANPVGRVYWIGFWGDLVFAQIGLSLWHLVEETGKWQRVGNDDRMHPSAGRVPGTIRDSANYNGSLYLLAYRDGEFEGHVLSTTGQDLVTVVDIPFAAAPRCLEAYAGRLYIGATGYDLDGNDRHGELYELTGNSLRLVRTFGGAAGAGGKRIPGIYSLTQADGLLWMPNSDTGHLECYDAANDAFFTGPEVPWASQHNGRVALVKGFRDRILCWVDNTTAAASTWRGVCVLDGGWVDTHDSAVETSDFGPEPARTKRWSRVSVETRLGPVSGLAYSVNGGATWTDLGPGTTEQSGDLWMTTWDVTSAPQSHRIRLSFGLRQAPGSRPIELVSHTLSFLMAPTGKHGWQLTIPAVWELEQLDGDVEHAVSPADRVRAFWDWFDARTVLALRDRDGRTYQVQITSPVEGEPHQGHDSERVLSCYLVEV